jgi:hypothetical protein
MSFIPGSNAFLRCKKKSSASPMSGLSTKQLSCHQNINYKTLNSNADVNQSLTQVQRQVNAIKYSVGVGGQIVFGSQQTRQPQQLITFLGKTEGQPGGIKLGVRNKF